MSNVLCTLELAKKKFPGSKNNLNALCRKFNISLESREKHGALTDCHLLHRVFIELMGGKQEHLSFVETSRGSKSKQIIDYINRKQILIDVSEEEKTFHKNMLNKIPKAIWNS